MVYRTNWERVYEKQKAKHGEGFWSDMIRLLTGLITIKDMAGSHKMTYERVRQIRNATRSEITREMEGER